MSYKSNSIKYKIAFLKSGLTQREIAHKLGFAESYISLLVSGKRKNATFTKFLTNELHIDNLEDIV